MTSPDTDLARYRQRIEEVLERRLGDLLAPPRLLEAMRYAVLGGGKRLRASLVYAAGEALSAAGEDLDSAACAVELIHAYSLVHDDLPCMDNDDMRRGKPSCHKAFGEAMALLAGDALQAAAFGILAAGEPARRLPMLYQLARGAGAEGMAGGQAIDLAVTGQQIALETLEDMHRRKTGALIRTSVLLGGLAGGADDSTLASLGDYGDCIGLAWQITDDVLDMAEDAGRPGGAAAKATYPALIGLEATQVRATALRDHALAKLGVLGDNKTVLARLAELIIDRNH